MKILVAEHYGLCFGVRDAIVEAEEHAQHGPLTILGELVHNPVVRDRLAGQGVLEGSLNELSSPTSRVMITAHGASDRKREEWKNAGFTIADATCPLVKSAHNELWKLVEQGCFPVIIGKRGHAEVEGLAGDFPGAWIVEDDRDIAMMPVHSLYGVISQTTQPIDKVRALVELIRRERPACGVRFSDTVCQPTKNRQNALRKLIGECDTLVVVGGRNSNNTLQLVAAATVEGLRVFHVERPDEIDPLWFCESKVTGLTAGTSTLKETVAAVQCRLEQIASTRQPDV